MRERRGVVENWKAGRGGVLVTLVRAEGSSYRRPGARLLTHVSGKGHTGTISGGCLEAEVVRRAAWLAREHAVVERYSMSFDDTADIPYGLGCGGAVDLLFEPLHTPEADALLLAMAASLEGRESTSISFLPDADRGLRRLVLDSEGDVVFASPGLRPEKIACARRLEPGHTYEGRFVERLTAPQRLILVGAGDDAKPLAELAALLGWSVLVADSRAQLVQPDRFPQAEKLLVLSAGRLGGLSLCPNDAVILMTHSYEQDRDWLTALLANPPRYLGLLGSRHRSSLLVSEAAAALGKTVDECCEHLFAPVGLPLGGDGPEAIALAIVAEIQAIANGGSGSSRRLGAPEIAEQIERGGASVYLQAQCALNT